MDYGLIVKYVYKGKGLHIAINEDYPMFNVADINAILGNGNLEGAVNRAKKAYLIEENKTGSEFELHPTFEKGGTPPQLWTDFTGVILLSTSMVQPYDSEKMYPKSVDNEFSEWLSDFLIKDLCGSPRASQSEPV
jgi:hypothetical protein